VTIRPPRRIFNSQPAKRGKGGAVGRTVMAGLVGAVIGAFVVLLALPSDLFGRVPSPSGSIRADAAQVAVIDGDTLRLQETIIRLQGVAAPPRGFSCRRADGAAFDCGAAAVAALADLVRGRTILCHIAGRDNSGFPQGMCEAGETDINRRLVADGWARARADMPAFSPEESRARRDQRGLWRGGASF
jgi:endonuclease YncB( thermonuclease family)